MAYSNRVWSNQANEADPEGEKEFVTIDVGASPVPHAEILKLSNHF